MKKAKELQEKRLSGEMSTINIFTPICNSCLYNAIHQCSNGKVTQQQFELFHQEVSKGIQCPQYMHDNMEEVDVIIEKINERIKKISKK